MFSIICFSFLLSLDRISKINAIQSRQAVWNFEGIFSIPVEVPIVLSIVAIIILLLYRKQSNPIIWAGVIGNTIDRLFYGGVIDFIPIQILGKSYIYNVADILITFGTLIVIIQVLAEIRKGERLCETSYLLNGLEQ